MEKKTNNKFNLGYFYSNKFEFKRTRQLKLKEYGGQNISLGVTKILDFGREIFSSSPNLSVAVKLNRA